MATPCLISGNFPVETLNISSTACIISINNNINTELENYFCPTPLGGATIGTINIAAYTSVPVLSTKVQRASVTIPWLRKYDCENDKVYFIFVGQGRSFNIDADDVTINIASDYTTQLLSASSQSGPTTLYSDLKQEEGFGMSYTGGPISFDTTTEASCRHPNMGFGKGDFCLSSFYLEAQIGSLPIVTYTFVYQA